MRNASRNSNAFSTRLKLSIRPDAQSQSVSFGATVTLSTADGKTETYTVVGVDELDFVSNAVSWISPTGKALLASELGDSITLEDGRSAKIE